MNPGEGIVKSTTPTQGVWGKAVSRLSTPLSVNADALHALNSKSVEHKLSQEIHWSQHYYMIIT